MTQQRLAEVSKVAQTTIASIENGRNQGSTKIPKLAACLGVEALWLAEGEGPRHRNEAKETVAPYVLSAIESDLVSLFSRLTPRQQDEEIKRLTDIANENDRMQRELNARGRAAAREIPRAEGKLYSEDLLSADKGTRAGLKTG